MSSRLPITAYEVLKHLPLPMADVWNEITRSPDGLFYPRPVTEDQTISFGDLSYRTYHADGSTGLPQAECALRHSGLVIHAALSATPDAGTFDLHTRIEQATERSTTPLAMLSMSLDASTNSATLQRCSLGLAGPSADFATAQQSATKILQAISIAKTRAPAAAVLRALNGQQAPAVNYVRNSLASAPVAGA